MPRHLPLVLVIALLAVSASGVMVVAVDGVHPVVLALGRTALVALLLIPGLRPIAVPDLLRIGLAGLCLAAHFVTWFMSLETTSVMRSTLLVCLNPAWAGLLGWFLLRERPQQRFWYGLAVALVGVLVLASGGDGNEGSWRGDLLATLGGILAAAYFVLGRSVRARVGIGTYACLVCASAAGALGLATWVLDLPVLAGLDTRNSLLIVGLALGPQLLGHNGFNYALRWLPASTVASVVLLEPVGATLLAFLLLSQVPTLAGILGGVLVLAGVLHGARGQ